MPIHVKLFCSIRRQLWQYGKKLESWPGSRWEVYRVFSLPVQAFNNFRLTTVSFRSRLKTRSRSSKP
ncbi:hypothetical protein [Nostoc sp. DSM 114161]|uniref:hypothetical protein n=1 Tax=Nostoc sp. DSM 114161 TaxID=3440143 RepID=UPI004045400A